MGIVVTVVFEGVLLAQGVIGTHDGILHTEIGLVSGGRIGLDRDDVLLAIDGSQRHHPLGKLLGGDNGIVAMDLIVQSQVSYTDSRLHSSKVKKLHHSCLWFFLFYTASQLLPYLGRTASHELKSIDKLRTALPQSLQWLKDQGYEFKIFP